MLRGISIGNYKSLKAVNVSLKPLSFFCGPNASGKSNFADALDFLSQVFRVGMQHAVAEKGGFYNICLRRIRRAKGPIRFQILGRTKLQQRSIEYEVEFSFGARTEAIRSDFLVEQERYRLVMTDEKPPCQSHWLVISRQKDAYEVEGSEGIEKAFDEMTAFVHLNDLKDMLARVYRPRPQQLLLSPILEGFGVTYFFPFRAVARELEGLRVFQINSRIARQAGVPSVMKGMGLHGENLPVVIASFLENKNLTPRLMSWVQDVIPELSNLTTGYTETKRVGFFLQEKGFGSPWYAEDLSDGTVMALALFICLLEPTHRVVVIEEPENSLHPWILKRFLDRCREASEERQIILTTHSPLTVAAARPEELFLMERRNGATEVVPAVNRDPKLPEVINQNVMDLGEYWLSGGIGAVPEPPSSADLFPASETLPGDTGEDEDF